MIRIRFSSDQDRIQGNYLLATKSVARRFRNQLFEISESDRKLLDDHQIAYQIILVSGPPGPDEEIRDPLTAYL